jgi:GWxTD domain-containing protein
MKLRGSKYRAVVSTAVALFVGFGRLTVQPGQPLQERYEDPWFFFDALVFAGDDSTVSRLDVFVQVPYQSLRFVHNDDEYTASYEETIDVYDPEDNLVVEKFAVERIRLASFQETVDPKRHHIVQRFFRLKPGAYKLAVQVKDEETKKSVSSKRTIDVRSLNDTTMAVSDIMLVSRLQIDGDVKTIVPNVSGNVGSLPEGFHLFSELYNKSDFDSVDILYHVKNSKNEEVVKEQLSQSVLPGKNQIFIKIKSEGLPMGSYIVGLQATARDGSGKRYATPVVTHPFSVRWTGMAATIEDLDLAIDQLVYIAETKDISHIKSAPSMEEKKKRFFEFWKKRDTNPVTERNEAMEDYYGRVKFANENFSHYRDGWKTDRGMVYVMFGTPSVIDRHPFEGHSKPYEVWTYYDLNYRFLFVDQTGFGDYRLDPSTPIWDVRGRRQ